VKLHVFSNVALGSWVNFSRCFDRSQCLSSGWYSLTWWHNITTQKTNFQQHRCKKVKQSHYRPGQAQRVPGGWGSQISRQSAHEGGKVVSPMHRPRLPSRKYSWYSFLLVGESTPGPEGLCEWKIPVTPSGIEPATVLSVAQCLNQLRHRGPNNTDVITWILAKLHVLFYVNNVVNRIYHTFIAYIMFYAVLLKHCMYIAVMYKRNISKDFWVIVYVTRPDDETWDLNIMVAVNIMWSSWYDVLSGLSSGRRETDKNWISMAVHGSV
jgi:hypothetical protein